MPMGIQSVTQPVNPIRRPSIQSRQDAQTASEVRVAIRGNGGDVYPTRFPVRRGNRPVAPNDFGDEDLMGYLD